MSLWASEQISFDMSRGGLLELSRILEPVFTGLSPEGQNFANEIRSMVQKAPAAKQEEPSWLDE